MCRSCADVGTTLIRNLALAMTTVPPPFPADVSSHPLLIVDYQLVENGNPKEIDKLWEAATQLGFW